MYAPLLEAWSGLSPEERNERIGDLLEMKPATQCWIGIAGKRFWITPHTEEKRDEAQALIDYFTKSDKNWAFFVKEKKGACDEMRSQLEVIVERWHIRYSDTPGGGWQVVEWLRNHGTVWVMSRTNGWGVVFDDGHPNHGRIDIGSATMADAACQVAIAFCTRRALAGLPPS